MIKINNYFKKKNMIIFFFSNWCLPCKKLKKKIFFLEKKIKILFLKINIDEHPEIAINFNINSIPTILILNKINYFIKGNDSIINIINTINEIIKR